MRFEPPLGTAAGEFVRFLIVGLASNAVLFLLYLFLTAIGIGHKVAATLAYAIGALQTFAFNRAWSFRDGGAPGAALGRYVVVYGLGYVLNMLVLSLAVDRAGYPHQWVQGFTILFLAVLLFLLQKVWVFREAGTRF